MRIENVRLQSQDKRMSTDDAATHEVNVENEDPVDPVFQMSWTQVIKSATSVGGAGHSTLERFLGETYRVQLQLLRC